MAAVFDLRGEGIDVCAWSLRFRVQGQVALLILQVLIQFLELVRNALWLPLNLSNFSLFLSLSLLLYLSASLSLCLSLSASMSVPLPGALWLPQSPWICSTLNPKS